MLRIALLSKSPTQITAYQTFWLGLNKEDLVKGIQEVTAKSGKK